MFALAALSRGNVRLESTAAPQRPPLLGTFAYEQGRIVCFVVPWMAGGTAMDYVRAHADTVDRLKIVSPRSVRYPNQKFILCSN